MKTNLSVSSSKKKFFSRYLKIMITDRNVYLILEGQWNGLNFLASPTESTITERQRERESADPEKAIERTW